MNEKLQEQLSGCNHDLQECRGGEFYCHKCYKKWLPVEEKCCCGEPWDKNVVHRNYYPCYQKEYNYCPTCNVNHKQGTRCVYNKDEVHASLKRLMKVVRDREKSNDSLDEILYYNKKEIDDMFMKLRKDLRFLYKKLND